MDWPAFLRRNHIEFVTRGPNVVARRSVAVKCPLCGPADQSQHMVIMLHSGNWFCWRNRRDHKGSDPARLIQLLINCSYEHAQSIVGIAALPDDFLSVVKAQFAPPVRMAPRALALPDEFKPLALDLPSARPFIRYLHGPTRQMSDNEILDAADFYDLRYCRRGSYAGRIIFPIYHEGKLVSWTGRTINSQDSLRYRALSVDEDRAQREGYPPAIGPTSHYLLYFDELMDAVAHSELDTIILSEGPFDALNINLKGWNDGIGSTCFFTSAPTQQQIALLHELLPRFKRRVLLLDQEADALAMRITADLIGLDVEQRHLPTRVKDPALMSQRQLMAI